MSKEEMSIESLEGDQVIEMDINRLRDFKNHPFKVTADISMVELKESIQKFGILNPLIVRPVMEGYYEIISGHRRRYAAKQLGYNPPVYPASCSRSKHTEEFVTPFRSSPSIMPLYPVRTVAVDFCPVLPCGVTIKLFSFKCLSLDLLSPVRRSSSARLILARLKFSPCSCFISLIACVMIFCKSLHVASSCINPPFLMHWLIISIRG